MTLLVVFSAGPGEFAFCKIGCARIHVRPLACWPAPVVSTACSTSPTVWLSLCF